MTTRSKVRDSDSISDAALSAAMAAVVLASAGVRGRRSEPERREQGPGAPAFRGCSRIDFAPSAMASFDALLADMGGATADASGNTGKLAATAVPSGRGATAAPPGLSAAASTTLPAMSPSKASLLSASRAHARWTKPMLPHEALEATREERVRARWLANQRYWAALRRAAAVHVGRGESETVVASIDEYRRLQEVRGIGRMNRTHCVTTLPCARIAVPTQELEVMEQSKPPREDMSAAQFPMLLRDCGSRFALVGGNLFTGLWIEIGRHGRITHPTTTMAPPVASSTALSSTSTTMAAVARRSVVLHGLASGDGGAPTATRSRSGIGGVNGAAESRSLSRTKMETIRKPSAAVLAAAGILPSDAAPWDTAGELASSTGFGVTGAAATTTVARAVSRTSYDEGDGESEVEGWSRSRLAGGRITGLSGFSTTGARSASPSRPMSRVRAVLGVVARAMR